MKKTMIVIMIFIIGMSLTACRVEKTYDDLYLEYLTHLEKNEVNYQSTIDYFNHVSSETIKSVVHIEKAVYGIGSSSGSGVIIKADENHYYILTNNHVVYVADNIIRVDYIVTDYLGNEYSAILIENSEDYDLAILEIGRRSINLPVIELALHNPYRGTNLAILGFPSFQLNAITIGDAIDYAPIEVSSAAYEIINVLFDVLICDVPVKSGSSGSVVINRQYQLVGIVYAGNFEDTDDTSKYTFCIPVEKVFEFFQLKHFSLEDES